jgi:hypothetical protein
VLIALGVLRKEGRKIVCEQDEKSFKMSCNKSKIDALKKQLKEK